MQFQGRRWLRPGEAVEIQPVEWEDFCDWFTQSYQGILATLQRQEGGDVRTARFIDRPLQELRAHHLENNVPAVSITVEGKPDSAILADVTGPNRMTLHVNDSGWPNRLVIGYEQGEAAVLFSGEPRPGRSFTANSWGE